MSSPAIVARELVLERGRRVALRAADFAVPRGSLTSVIGPNGSGKSTLLHAVAGLIEPASGTLEVLGGAPRDCHAQVGYVFQSAAVNERLPVTVREVVAMGRYARLGSFGRFSGADRAAVDDAMDRLAIHDLAQRHLRELSGGQRQRVFVAQGLAQQAEVLLLDEPITGLDIPSHERIDTVVDDERARGTTVVLTTHDVSEASRADHVLLLGGREVASGPPDRVLTEAGLAEAYGADLLHFGEGHIVLDDPHHVPAAPPHRHDSQ